MHELCSSYDEHSTSIPSDAILTITSLQEAINQPGLSANYDGPYDHKYDLDKTLFVFHHACNNENVTLEIIKFLLNNNIRSFPDSPRSLCTAFATLENDETSISETYPLHLACTKEFCPSDVIRFLIKQYPHALEHPSNINGGIGYDYDVYQVAGLPLHYYLARSRDIDIDTVKMMLEVYPQSLMTTGEEEDCKACYPIHALLSNECTNNLQEILAYLVELNPSVIRMLDGFMKAPLHLACRNSNMTLEVVQYIFNKWPEAIRMENERGWLPIHELCYNIDIEKTRLGDIALYEILQFMLDVDSTLISEEDNSGYLPIHHAVDGMSTKFCKALIKAYPESISVESEYGSLPIHEACGNGYSYDITKTIRYLLELYPTSINARNGDGDMPIHSAARQFGRDYIIELLLSYDPDGASKETDQRQLPLHLVCAKQHYNYEYLDMVKVLYEAYPEAINARDEDGNTPLCC